jgi:dicarboxylate transporter 10
LVFIGGVATLLTMPLDVMKTRMMNAPQGTYNSLIDCFKDIVKVGPSGLFKGFIPAFIRLGKIFYFSRYTFN